MNRPAAALFASLALFGCDELNPADEGASGGEDELALFSVAPDVGACAAGALTPEYQARIVQRVNQIRLHHELPPVAISQGRAPAAQAAALVAVANAKLSHSPSPGAFCYSAEAAEASSESLLFLSAGNQVGNVRDPDRFLGDWLRDANVASLGHRRWLLDPFVAEVAFGFVQGEPKVDFPYSPVVGAALHVVDDQDTDLSWWPNDFVAYPFGLYPAGFVDRDWLFSFSVVADKSQRLGSANKVSFASATVEVKDESGAALAVSGVSGADDLIGLPNVLTWRADGVAHGELYTVRVGGVSVDGVARDFEYEFLLVP